MFNSKCPLVLLCVASLYASVSPDAIYESPGPITLGVIFTQCDENLTSAQQTTLHSAIWTAERVNNLKLSNLKDFQLGLAIFQVCSEQDYLSAIFNLYTNSQQNDNLLLGVIGDFRDGVSSKVREFSEILKINFHETEKFNEEVIKATVKVLEVFEWGDDLEVIATDQSILKEFYRITRKEWMCVNRFHLHETFVYDSEENSSHPIIFLGYEKEISSSLSKLQNESGIVNQKVLLVPFDSETVHNVKENYYTLTPTYSDPEEPLTPPKIIPSPIFFEIASPILHLVESLVPNLSQDCQNTTNGKCIQIKSSGLSDISTLPDIKMPDQNDVLKTLKLESLLSEFRYVLRQSNADILSYSIFDSNVTILKSENNYHLKRNISKSECFQHFDHCLLECENFKTFEVTPVFVSHAFLNSFRLRPEPWVYAFFSLSLLGILFCVAILGFILSRLCRKQVLEGNPILTILLILDVILMYLSVLPFSVEGNKLNRYEIYIVRAVCVTIPYTFAFALLLSRTILLATVSSEVGFMSHIAGTVQGFLTLFIFAVQCALSLQLSNNCDNASLNSGYSLISLMSYNVVLLILLVFITPLIAKSKRNYREGKHFTIAIILCACAWSGWLPAYAVLDEAWKDPLLCLGLVSTGSILLGSVFIPRTYMMTVSAARERFTSALPSLATATSAMDIYRASTQPVYDCVNVAAIAAANLRAQHEEERRRATYYSAQEVEGDVEEEDEEEDEFVVQACDSPPIDKVTRF